AQLEHPGQDRGQGDVEEDDAEHVITKPPEYETYGDEADDQDQCLSHDVVDDVPGQPRHEWCELTLGDRASRRRSNEMAAGRGLPAWRRPWLGRTERPPDSGRASGSPRCC